MRMLEDGARAARFEHFSDERLAAYVAEVSGLQLTPFEQGILDDVKAEITRRAALAAVSKQINDGAD